MVREVPYVNINESSWGLSSQSSQTTLYLFHFNQHSDAIIKIVKNSLGFENGNSIVFDSHVIVLLEVVITLCPCILVWLLFSVCMCTCLNRGSHLFLSILRIPYPSCCLLFLKVSFDLPSQTSSKLSVSFTLK